MARRGLFYEANLWIVFDPRANMNDLNLPEQFIIALIIREGKAIIPKGTTRLLAGDEVVAVTTADQENVLDRLFRGELIRQV